MFFVFVFQRNLYTSVKRRYFTDDDDGDDDSSSEKKSLKIESGDKKLCSINCLYEDKLDASNDNETSRSVIDTAFATKLQHCPEVIAAEMGDMVENNNNDDGNGDAVRKISVSEETEKDDKFPQQMNTKNPNWNMMELGEKRKRLR